MNYEYNNIYEVRKAWLEALGGDSTGADNAYEVSLRILEWYQSHSGGTCEHPIDITMDVTKAISAYTGSMAWVYDKDAEKWYVRNSLNEYEEYGVMETVEALSATTSYPGKLVILSAATPHEYEYVNGWNDLGALNIEYYGEFDGKSYFDSGVQAKNNLCVEYVATYYRTESATPKGGSVYGSRRVSSGAGYSNGGFPTTDTQLNVDLGSQRTASNTNYVNKEIHMKAWLYTSGTTNTNVKYGIVSTVDGGPFINASGTTTGANYTDDGSGRNMFIGAMNSNGTPMAQYFYGLIKSFKMYESIDANGDGEITHNYTFVNDGGVVKMYDTVTDTLFPNQGTGSVTILPIYTPIKDYTYKNKPISSYSAETYCDLYDISSDFAYVGLYGDVAEDESVYVINDEKKWEETSYPTIEYDGLIFKALEGGSAIAMNNLGGNTPALQISYDGDTWETWDYSEIDLGLGQEVAFRGTNMSVSTTKYSTFVTTGNLKASGKIISLIDNGACTATTFKSDYQFYKLFQLSTGLTDCSKLEFPAFTRNICYNYMFSGCTSLTAAPEILPSTALTTGCYDGMFQACAFTTAPVLLGKATDSTSCSYLYHACSSLNYVECMLETIAGNNATTGWMYGVASAGTFVKSTAAWWTTTGQNGVPNGWTIKYSGQTEASTATIALTSGASAYTFYVQTDSFAGNTWEITEYPTWCTLDRTTKQGDRTAVKVTPQANNDEPRTGNLVITATDRVITIAVSQEGYSLEFENLYQGYKGKDRYWYVQYNQTQQDVNIVLGNQTKAWEITDYPDWVTVSPTAGTGTTLLTLTASANTENNYREEFVTVESGARQVKLRIMQYQYPVVLSSNLGNRYHNYNANEPISGSNCFGFDIAVGDVVPAAYDFVGMKSITCRSESSFRTNPYVKFDLNYGNGFFYNITKIEIDADTIIQMEQAFNSDGSKVNGYPNCTSVTVTNCDEIVKGFSINTLKSATTISIGNLPAVATASSALFPSTTTLTDLSIGSLYANKGVILSGCTNLTVTSLVNVLNALPDNTGTSYSQTCKLGATNLAKLTAEQIAIGTNKGWAVT